jgi:hypothetical protein
MADEEEYSSLPITDRAAHKVFPPILTEFGSSQIDMESTTTSIRRTVQGVLYFS